MRIDVIKAYNLNRNQALIRGETKQQSNAVLKNTSRMYPVGYMPHQVYFGSAKLTRIPAISELINLPNLLCAYCEKLMIPKNVSDSLLEMKSSPVEYSNKAIELIRKHKDFLFPVEKEVFENIESYKKSNTQATLQEVMNDLRPKYIKDLSTQQLGILTDIDKTAQELPDVSGQKVLNITATAKKTITKDDFNNPFKIKKFMSELNSVLEKVHEKSLRTRIRKIAKRLPSSSDDAGAFVAKYSVAPIKDKPQERPKRLEDRISESEIDILQAIKQRHEKTFPGATSQELINNLLLDSGKTDCSAISQNAVVETFKTNADNIIKNFTTNASDVIGKTRIEVNDSSSTVTGIRTNLLKGLSGLSSFINKESLNNLYKTANAMPTSQGNIDELIAKHSDKFGIKGLIDYKMKESLSDDEKTIFKKIINVKKKQRKLLTKLKRNISSIPQELKQNILNLTTNFKDKNPYEQTRIIEQLKQLKTPFNEETHKKFIEPLSKKDDFEKRIDEFISKYADRTSNFYQKSNEEIAQGLLRNAVASIEHLKTQNAYKKAGQIEGRDSINNLALVHSKCNSEREHSPLITHIRRNPEIPKNAQKQIDFIINKINNGTLKHCDNYPVSVTPTYHKESKGLIKLDTSRLIDKTILPEVPRKELELAYA